MAIKKIKNPKKSARYYAANPEARKKKADYDTKFQSKPSQKAKKRLLGAKRRELTKKLGKKALKGKDLAHSKGGKLRLQPLSKNRGSKTAMPGDKRARGKKSK